MIARRIYIQTDGSHVRRRASIYLEHSHATHAISSDACSSGRKVPTCPSPALRKLPLQNGQISFALSLPRTESHTAETASGSNLGLSIYSRSCSRGRFSEGKQCGQPCTMALCFWRGTSHSKKEALKTLAGPAALIIWLVVGLSKRWARLFSSASPQKTKSAGASSMLFFDFFQ